jgi:hypothetical protein
MKAKLYGTDGEITRGGHGWAAGLISPGVSVALTGLGFYLTPFSYR